jgi:glycosyltransferase involved in cell wall biosynthesis
MKNILLVVDFKPRLRRGLELWLIALAAALRERGIKFHVLVSGEGPEWFVEAIEKGGGQVITKPTMRGRFHLPTVNQVMAATQPEVAIFMFYPMLSLPVLRAARHSSVKRALFFDHSSIPLTLKTGLKGLLTWIRGQVLGRIYWKIVTVSGFKRQRLIERLGLPPSRVHLIYNGVDICQFADVARNIPTDAPFLYVGQIELFKGIPTLLDAYTELRQRNPGCPQLHLAGMGSLRDSLEQEMKRRGMDGSVQFLGLRDDVRELMMSSRAILIPSEWDEACAMVALEAMASGRPVLASDAGSLPELLGEHGVIFPARNSRALGEAMERLLDPAHHDEYEQSVASLRKRVAETFTFDQMVRGYADTLSTACGLT